ncbi:hypothetical protein IL306_014941, partial [Fusarium sp. DS 682]
MWTLLEANPNVDANIYSYKDHGDPYESTLEDAWGPILAGLSSDASRLLDIFSLLDPDKIPSHFSLGHESPGIPGLMFLTDDF